MSPQMETVAFPTRLPLIVETTNRDNSVSKDSRLVNCYVEVSNQQEVSIFKRPGTASAGVIASNQAGRGVYFWRGDVYSIFAGVLYRNGTSVATGLDQTTGSVSGSGVYQFSEILGATPRMVLGNGTRAYAYDVVNGLTANLNSININYPAVTTKGFAYLNGATYVMQTAAVIWGSGINSVSVAGDWTALNFISAQLEPDPGVAINKQLVYVVAFNSWSTEIFSDAGNATGSPLAAVQGSKASYGCASSDSVQRIDDVLFWMCTNQTASLQIASMEQLGVSIVSTPAIDRLLEGINVTTVFSWQLKIDGHSFYVITFKLSNLTLVYDITTKLWVQWTDKNGNYFPIVASAYDSSGRRILQHESDGRLLYASTRYKKDVNDSIVLDIYTPIFDAGTRRRKQLNFLEVIGDQVEGSMMEARCSDNDYQTWSSPRMIDLGSKKPTLINCGTFVKRAYHFRHSLDTEFRISAVEVQYDIGTL